MTSVGGEQRHYDRDANVVKEQEWAPSANRPNDQKCYWASPYRLQDVLSPLWRYNLRSIRVQFRLPDSSTTMGQ